MAIPNPDKVYLWEVLLPADGPSGKHIRHEVHRKWDRRVRKITNGLTIMQPVHGQWLSNDGKLFLDKMIPVRIVCTEPIMHQIADFSAEYYDQKTIMYYRLSGVVYFTKLRETKREEAKKQKLNLTTDSASDTINSEVNEHGNQTDSSDNTNNV